MTPRRRKRVLREDERALWEHVSRSVAPLRPRPALPAKPETPPPEEPAPPAETEGRAPKGLVLHPRKRPLAPAAPPPPPLTKIEPKVRRKLNRGADVDARLDLHGLTQAAAHRRLHLFIMDAQAAGHSLVLVITGKGDSEGLGLGLGLGWLRGGEAGRGVLRRAVPQWLSDHALRPYVVGFENAARHHGGEGALYVRIRRRRERS
ncbi:DNA-nicking Smr family endonuclease [Azorhizobium sp. AG788]|uniref:Smr/MutS family protein n=1 Tax=Azorhizobium sp. AG788 TaxID=2183897 RepID=UPI00105E2479|nr:Smr/MutS family protein [Azorhizobium sp. AG788]TDT91312.1 DNA-nicking Smr family endonuclease [Azorhizobium sp. AG788]